MTNEEKNEKLKELTGLFSQNIEQYKNKSYDESNTRTDFIDKFFELLDWDVRNVQGYSEQYREVVREDKVRIENKQKAPDYSFRIGGLRKFFVEAKKPFINIKEESEAAFQVRRYGYTAKLPLSILTNFEEFSIYDTRIKPHKNDKASAARIFYCSFNEYEKNFDFIYNTFSKTAILKGSFDKYIQENKNKKGTSEVDKELLLLIEDWRSELAKNIALKNLEINIYDLNIAVQRIIDRIIFLRIAEDRKIEPYENLLKSAKQKNVFKNINLLFEKADEKYNAGLFKKEEWLSGLNIDDKILSNIITGLYYPECPYEFSILPIEILGNIYEQFLGKTIRLTAGHNAKVEEKPEVRKAGGVYYTPKYIVNYIVDNTVGEKIKDKTPEEISEIKILDPACGSGSFLVGAYSFLLQYHLEYYTAEHNLKRSLKSGKIYEFSEKNYFLSIEEKQKILLNNIFGVDIDYKAGEVTKLSLYLKLLENENIESGDYLFKYSDLKLLPDLNNNIKCGNSLIGSDYYSDKNLSLFEDNEMRKINVFDWEKNFPAVFNNGGFDCVIGNPPYVVLSKEGYDNQYIEYLNKNYPQITYQLDAYLLFLVKAGQLSKGFVGVIVPNAYLGNLNIKEFRKWLINNKTINKIVMLPSDVFINACVDTTILIFSKYIENNKINIVKYENEIFKYLYSLNQNDFNNNDLLKININIDPKFVAILNKIKSNSIPLKNILDINRGVHAYRRDGYGKSKFSKGYQTEKDYNERSYHSKTKLDKTYKIEVRGKNIFRFFHNDMNIYISYGTWLAEPRKPYYFEKPRIYLRKIIGNTLHAAFSYTDNIPDQSVYVGIKLENNNYDLKYLLGLLNSKVLVFFFRLENNEFDNLFPQIKITEFKQLPVRKITFSNKNEKKLHTKLVSLVDQMIEVQKQYHNTKTESDKKLYKQKIEILDKQIDQLVYELYGLNEEEIKIIEGNLN